MPARRLQLKGASLQELKAQVLADHGPDAKIVAAEKVTVGGIRGFFAREHYEVTVELPEPSLRRAHALDQKSRAGIAALLADADRAESVLHGKPPELHVSTDTDQFAAIMDNLTFNTARPTRLPRGARPEEPGLPRETEPRADMGGKQPAAAPQQTGRRSALRAGSPGGADPDDAGLDGAALYGPDLDGAELDGAAPGGAALYGPDPGGPGPDGPGPGGRDSGGPGLDGRDSGGPIRVTDAAADGAPGARVLEAAPARTALVGRTVEPGAAPAAHGGPDPRSGAERQPGPGSSPPAPLYGAGDLVLVIGQGDDALETANAMAAAAPAAATAPSETADWIAGSGNMVKLAGSHAADVRRPVQDRNTALAARARGVERGQSVFVAFGLGRSFTPALELLALLPALGADQVWLAVDASRKPEDTDRWVRAVQRAVVPDALAVSGARYTSTPKSVNVLGVPVGWVDGAAAESAWL